MRDSLPSSSMWLWNAGEAKKGAVASGRGGGGLCIIAARPVGVMGAMGLICCLTDGGTDVRMLM